MGFPKAIVELQTECLPKGKYVVETSKYSMGGTALTLCTESGELATVVSVYLDEHPSDGCVWVKTWSENVGVLEALSRAGVLRATGRTAPAGFATAEEAEVLV